MSTITVAELFAGVGGFRLGLDAAGPYETVWANQWEPGTERRQFAWRCYESHFGPGSCVNEDIHAVLDAYESGDRDIPNVDMVVGGFPCQDYSVAKPLSAAHGIEGKKGVLWWDIYRFLRLKAPRLALFENVDRLLKSPASQRGRDFAIILSCLMSLGYAVEWRVVNSAAYGFPQRRKRVYIYAENGATWDEDRLRDGGLPSAFPVDVGEVSSVTIPDDPYAITMTWTSTKVSPFREAGVACGGTAWTAPVVERYDGRRETLGDVVRATESAPEGFYIDPATLSRWEYLKGSKRERRVAANGHEYMYSEGAMAFPDTLDRPSRTILTGEGGTSPSRFKHVVDVGGRLRRLVPEELEALQGFPRGWTDTGMTDGQRAFCMGNALVVGVVERIGREIYSRSRVGSAL